MWMKLRLLVLKFFEDVQLFVVYNGPFNLCLGNGSYLLFTALIERDVMCL